LGGLSKKAYRFNKVLQAKDLPFLILDGGALLFKNTFITASQEVQAKITADGIVKAYNLIGYDAVGVSSRDLAGGIDFLLELASRSDFAWLSANIIDSNSNKPIFKPAVSMNIGARKAAVLGLTDTLHARSESLGPGFKLKSWQQTLPKVIEEMRSTHDFMILLTSVSEKTCREIARAHPEINLIIQAGGTSSNQSPLLLTDNTLLTRTGKQGKYIGIMEVDWQKGGKWDSGQEEKLIASRNEIDRLNWQITRHRNRLESKELHQKLENRRLEVNTEVKRLEQELRDRLTADVRPSSYKSQFIAMDISLPDQPTVLEIVNETNRLVNEAGENTASSEAVAGITGPIGKGFVGWTKCQKCHNKEASAWLNTRHATAFLTLIEKNQQFNLQCVPCHVTGIDNYDPAGALTIPRELQQVGCEACHGPGQNHLSNPTNSTRPVTEQICLSCHTEEQDDNFDFISDAPKSH